MLSLRFQEGVLHRVKQLEHQVYRKQYDKLGQTLRSMENGGWELYRKALSPSLPRKEEIKSVCVFKPDEIGDAVHSLPALRELKKYYSEARFFLICQKATEPIFQRTRIFDEISSVEVKKVFIRFPVFSVSNALKAFSEKAFDLSVFLRTYPAYFQHFLRVPAKYQLHPLDPRMRSRSSLRAPVSLWGEERKHQAYQLKEIVSLLTGERDSLSEITYPSFCWNDDDKKAISITFGKNIPGSYFVIHPFARYETRRYPLEYWKRVCEWLKSFLNIPIVVIGGKEDEKIPWMEPTLQMQGRISLAQSGYLISRARAFLGNESGPAHWAAVLGVPTVTIFGGHSLAEEWAPVGNTLLLKTAVTCSPCHRRVCPGLGLKCLRDMMPENFIPELERFLM